MKIKKLRKTFERALPYYQQAVDENWDYYQLFDNNMHNGLCYFSRYKLNVPIFYIFPTHYKHFLKRNKAWLFPTTWSVSSSKSSSHIKKSIAPRLEFLKEEIKRLKKLEKQGYTHI